MLCWVTYALETLTQATLPIDRKAELIISDSARATDWPTTTYLSNKLTHTYVPISRAKPIGSLYEDVADYDLVVVSDPPIADALNNRLTRPHIGSFAVTPRRLATGRKEPAEDRTAFLSILEETDLSWKELARIIGDIIQCWEETAAPDRILSYERYDTPAVRSVLTKLKSLDTTSRLLTEYQIPNTQRVAVVGENQLTPLEQSILPEEYDTIDLFTDDAFPHPPFRIFNSRTAIVDALLDTISEENAEDIAIVLDGSSQYSSLIESALETANIPFYGGPGFNDEPDHRLYIQLLRTATAGSNTRVASVQPLLEQLDCNVDPKHADKRLDSVDSGWFDRFSATIDNETFGSALTAFETRRSVTLEQFRDELTKLGIINQPVTTNRVDQLEFYLDSYEVPIDRENEGVLLADATSAAYVDRLVVFAIGLDDGWMRAVPNRPWTDEDAVYQRNIGQFQHLLQSGVEQYYLVEDAQGGQPVTPCLYFEDLLETPYERFSGLRSIQHTRTHRARGDGFSHTPLDDPIDPTHVNSMSQSALNNYVHSPRDYFFDRLLSSPDKIYFTEGQLFHDFAEFYVNHPELIASTSVGELLEFMLDQTDPFLRTIDRETQRTRFNAGVTILMEFLDEHQPTHSIALAEESGFGENVFETYFDKECDSPVTERYFTDDTLGVHGLIDYVYKPTHLIDYKTGAKKSRSKVVKHSAIDLPTTKPNFQALLYLTYQRRQQPDEVLSFTFVHFMEAIDDVVNPNETPNLEDIQTTVRYYPELFASFAESQTAYEELCNGYKDCSGTFTALGYLSYQSLMTTHPFPDQPIDEIRDSAYAGNLTEAIEGSVGGIDADVEKGCDQALRALDGLRKRNYFTEDLDAFEEFLEDQRSKLNDRHQTHERFPVTGLAGETTDRYLNHRDLLLGHD